MYDTIIKKKEYTVDDILNEASIKQKKLINLMPIH
jgi:hypothetical protein